MKRFLSVALTACTLLALLPACGGNTGNTADVQTNAVAQNTETVDTTPATTLSVAEQRAATKDNLPEKDYKGADFAILINTFCDTGFFNEGLNGDILNDAVYQRNQRVEDRYNIKLDWKDEVYSQATSLFQTSVLAGDDVYQLAAHHCANATSWVTNGVVMNWYEIPYVDFSNPWWAESNANELTYKGINFLAVGDFALTTIGRTYCIYFDKNEAENNNLPDMYELVRSGEWTVDKLMEYAENAYRDTNGNGEKDTLVDFFGFTTSAWTNIDVWQQAFGISLVKDGEIVLDNDKMQSAVEKLIQLCYDCKGTCYGLNYRNAAGNMHYLGPETMQQEKTLFAVGMLESGIVYLREMEHDYGILPFPKYDENQEEYHCTIDLGFTALAVPLTVGDKERTGIITEALNAESYRSLVPTYYEYVLKQKAARDEESIEMIDFVMSTRIFDFGMIYDNFKGYSFWLERIVQTGEANYSSYYASNNSAVEEWYNEVFEAFDNYGK